MTTIENSNPFKLKKISKDSPYFIGGVDEVGRGPLAGPVVACSVAAKFHHEKHFKKIESALKKIGVTDSKKLTEKRRANLLAFLEIKIPKKSQKPLSFLYQETQFEFYLKELSPYQIDKLNILQASLKAMALSIEKISKQKNNIFLIDGNKAPIVKNKETKLFTIVKGDAKSSLIGLASIIAKQYRDDLMARYDNKFPEYGFASHSGYPTKSHKQTLALIGPCPIHRKTFKGVKEWVARDLAKA